MNRQITSLFYTLLALVLLLSPARAALTDDGWTAKEKLTILASAVDETLTQFPVFVDLSNMPDSFFTSVKVDGADIRVTKADQTTLLAYELVNLDPNTKTGQLWFKADSLSSNSNAEFWIFYANPNATALTNSQEVWANDYQAVYHLEEDPSADQANSIKDSSANNFSGTPNGNMLSDDLIQGQLGRALDFDGDDDRIELGDIDADFITISAWIQAGDLTSGIVVYKQSGAANTRSYQLDIKAHPYRPGYGISFVNGSPDDFHYSGRALEDIRGDGQWHYLVGTFNGTSLRCYLDGILQAENTLDHEIKLPQTDTTVFLGSSGIDPGSYEGAIDEVRIVASARSEAWLKAEYLNQVNAGIDFYILGDLKLLATSPVDDSTQVPDGDNLELYFNRPVDIQAGNLNIISNGALMQSIDLNSSAVTGNGTQSIIVNPPLDLLGELDYYINIDAGSFVDQLGNSFAGINDRDTWNFRTKIEPLHLHWSAKQKITVSATAIDEELIDFPVSIDLSDMPDSFFENVKDQGEDIRITKEDQRTELSFEVVSVDKDTKTGELWFKADQLSSSEDTAFYLFYDNPAAPAYPGNHQHGSEDVWSNAYKGVWHLGYDPSQTIKDSSANHFDGSSLGSMSSANLVNGQFSQALSFDGIDDAINVGDIDVDFLTISAWLKPELPGAYIVSKGYGKGIRSWKLSPYILRTKSERASHRTDGMICRDRSQRYKSSGVSDREIAADNQWHYITGTYERLKLSYYIDGALDSSGVAGPYVELPKNNEDTFIAKYLASYFKGQMDEVRIADITRSDAWIKAEYENQKLNTDFYTIESDELTLLGLSPTDDSRIAGVSEDLVLKFNQPIILNAGDIMIKKSANDFLVEKISTLGTRVRFEAENTLRVDPACVLKANTEYYVTLSEAAVKHSQSIDYPGILGKTTWNFRTNSWYHPRWFYRIKLESTSSNTLVGPVISVDLNDLGDSFFNHVSDDGADIRITQADGQTELARKIVSIDKTAKTGEVQFKVVANYTPDSVFYIYYGANSIADYSADHELGANSVTGDTVFGLYRAKPEEVNMIDYKFNQAP